MMEEAFPPRLSVLTATATASTESLALQQAQVQFKELQEQMRRQAEQAARDQADLKAAVGEKDKELEKTRKLVADAERIRKAQEWSMRMLGQGKHTTLGEKEKQLRETALAEGLMKPPAPVGTAVTAVGGRKIAVAAKQKKKMESGTAGSSTSSVTGPSSAATKIQQRLVLPSMAPTQLSPELGFAAMGAGLSPNLGQIASMVGEVAEEQDLASVLAQVPLASPTIQGAPGSLIGSVVSVGPSASTTSTTSVASATAGKGGRRKKGQSVKRTIQVEE